MLIFQLYVNVMSKSRWLSNAILKMRLKLFAISWCLIKGFNVFGVFNLKSNECPREIKSLLSLLVLTFIIIIIAIIIVVVVVVITIIIIIIIIIVVVVDVVVVVVVVVVVIIIIIIIIIMILPELKFQKENSICLPVVYDSKNIVK